MEALKGASDSDLAERLVFSPKNVEDQNKTFQQKALDVVMSGLQ
jgi:hypothetical protein